jgi:hypothetical protein
LSKTCQKVIKNFFTLGKTQKKRGHGAIVKKVQWCNSKKMSNSCHKVVQKLSKNCRKVVKKFSENVKNVSKISQKFVQKFVKNVSKKLVNNLPFCSDCPGKKKKKKIGGS